MPFQVVYSINTKKVVPLVLGGEGLEDITFLPLSLTQFTLTAEVLGGNPIGHSFEWQLIQDDNPFTPPEVSPLTIESFSSSIVLPAAYGNLTDVLFPDRQIWIYNSSDSVNDGPYIISSSFFIEGGSPQIGQTILEVVPNIPNPNALTPGLIRTQLGDDVYITQADFSVAGASPPPWPWIMLGASTTDFTLRFLYAPTGQAYIKKWRLWIDKGTPLEDFVDVKIFPFPQDTLTVANKPANKNQLYATLGSTLDCRALQEDEIRLLGFLEPGTAEIPPTLLELNWTYPSCSSDKLIGWDLEILQNGKWVSLQDDLPVSTQSYGPLMVTDVTRVISKYNEFENSGYYWSQPSFPAKLPDGAFGSAYDISTIGKGGGKNIELTSYNLTFIESATNILPDDNSITVDNKIAKDSFIELTSYNVTFIEAVTNILPDDSMNAIDNICGKDSFIELLSYNVTLMGGGGSG